MEYDISEIVDQVKANEKRLYSSIDAAVWAAEFMKVVNMLEIKGIDEGWMITWFANAIETGRQFGRSEIKACQCP